MLNVTDGRGQLKIVSLQPFGIRIDADHEGQDPHDLSVTMLRDLARQHHIVLLRGFGRFSTSDELASWAAAWGPIMEWKFGKVLELVEAEVPTDHIFDHTYVPLHWDGMYVEHVPEFQIFDCVSAPGDQQGGRTTFSHAARVLAEADPATADLWRKVVVTYRIENVVHYGGTAVSPLVVHHPVTGVETIRFNEPAPADDDEFLNRPIHQFDGFASDEVEERVAELRAALYEDRNFYAHAWQEGDVVIADNYTLLHGRESFTRSCPRHLRRVHVLGDPVWRNELNS